LVCGLNSSAAIVAFCSVPFMVSIMRVEALISSIESRIKHKIALLCAVYGIKCNPQLGVSSFAGAVKKELKTRKAYVSRILMTHVERLRLQKWMLLHYGKRRDIASLRKLLKQLDYEISRLKNKQLAKS